MPHLYELSDEYRFLVQALDDEEADTEAVSQQLAQITVKFNDKVENIGKLILSLEADSKKVKGEKDRLDKRKKSIDGKVDWLKVYLKQELINTKTEKVEGEILTVSLRKNPPSVKVVNEDDIPKEYMRHIPESWEVDKDKILDLFKHEKLVISDDDNNTVNGTTGEIIEGFVIETQNKRVEIR